VNEKLNQENDPNFNKKNYLEISEYLTGLEKYFETYPNFFKKDVSKGIFLLGVAVGKLLSAQRQRFKSNENAEPFWNSLYNLNLNKKKIFQIQTKVMSKLKYYIKYMPYPKNLIQSISKYIMKAGNEFRLSDIEISWYFSHGLASYYEVTNKNLIELIKN